MMRVLNCPKLVNADVELVIRIAIDEETEIFGRF